MNANTIKTLLELNRQFYQTFAVPFSDTRMRIQPGVLRVLETISHQSSILDLGCGNGELARTLEEQGFTGTYLGLDFSEGLLETARIGFGDDTQFRFRQTDLGSIDWDRGLQGGAYDYALAFAALHHIPGRDLHLDICQAAYRALRPGGQFIHSNWQFLNSDRLRKRIQPWSAAGLDDADVDDGDYLLDWRRGGSGLRYVHHFSSDELEQLAVETGFDVMETFYSDGQGGNLGLYQIWSRQVSGFSNSPK